MARAHVIVLGNAKGGSGKSTCAMHVAMRLMALDKTVALLDLDDRQQTLTRAMHNRADTARARNVALPMPDFEVVRGGAPGASALTGAQAYDAFCAALAARLPAFDCIVMDCPGADTQIARLAHGCADTLLTPMNDSFVDLDLLAHIDPDTHAVRAPSWYSEMVWAQRKRRLGQDGGRIDWVVCRNRLAHTSARNKRNVGKVLHDLGPRIGFRVGPSLGERVIFRELFLRGLTLSDLRIAGCGVSMSMAHVAAHQEVKALVAAIHSNRKASMGSSRAARSAG